MPSAAEKVFAVPELLEAILLNSDWRSLYVVQRVNTGFRGMIVSSTKLRQSMHLEYKKLDRMTTDLPHEHRTNNFIIDDLYEKKDFTFGPFITPESKSHRRTLLGQGSALAVAIFLPIPVEFHWRPDCQVIQQTSFWLRANTRTGSWRTMKLTSSSAPLCVEVEVYPPGGIHVETLYFEKGEGDLGEFVDAVHRLYLNGVDKYRKSAVESSRNGFY